MKNKFSYENHQQCDFQVNYNYYPQQPHDLYDYQQKIVAPTSTPDLSRLTIRQLNDLYSRSSFVEYEHHHTMSNNHILSVHLSHHMFDLVLNNNNMHHHNKLQQSMDHPIRKLCY